MHKIVDKSAQQTLVQGAANWRFEPIADLTLRYANHGHFPISDSNGIQYPFPLMSS
jgi:hypothetical protein